MSIAILSSAVDRGPSFAKWFDGLAAAKAAKVALGVETLARKGPGIGHAIGKDLVEFEIPGLPGVRVYAGLEGKRMILLLGEHRDVAPPVNQRNARKRWEEYKKRKRTEGAGQSRDFHDMVRDRARREAEFRRELLREAAQSMINGDFETARGLLRDVIHAGAGFAEVAAETGIPAKSLMRMFGGEGNPRAVNLFAVTGALRRAEGVWFVVSAAEAAR